MRHARTLAIILRLKLLEFMPDGFNAPPKTKKKQSERNTWNDRISNEALKTAKNLFDTFVFAF